MYPRTTGFGGGAAGLCPRMHPPRRAEAEPDRLRGARLVGAGDEDFGRDLTGLDERDGVGDDAPRGCKTEERDGIDASIAELLQGEAPPVVDRCARREAMQRVPAIDRGIRGDVVEHGLPFRRPGDELVEQSHEAHAIVLVRTFDRAAGEDDRLVLLSGFEVCVDHRKRRPTLGPCAEEAFELQVALDHSPRAYFNSPEIAGWNAHDGVCDRGAEDGARSRSTRLGR